MKDFQQAIKNSFYDILNRAGFQFPYTKDRMEKFNRAATTFGDLLEAKVRIEAVTVIRKLQEPVSKGFADVAKDMAELQARIRALEDKSEDNQ